VQENCNKTNLRLSDSFVLLQGSAQPQRNKSAGVAYMLMSYQRCIGAQGKWFRMTLLRQNYMIF